MQFWQNLKNIKHKHIYALTFALLSPFLLTLLLAPLAILFGQLARKEGKGKTGTISVLIGGFFLILTISVAGLTEILGVEDPILVQASGSMSHSVEHQVMCGKEVKSPENGKLSFNEWWRYCGDTYRKYDITKEEFRSYPFAHGVDPGEVLFVQKKEVSEIEIGDLLVFKPTDKGYYALQGLVVHRVVNKTDVQRNYSFETKGDANSKSTDNFEKDISEEDIIGEVFMTIPYVGWIFLIFDYSLIG